MHCTRDFFGESFLRLAFLRRNDNRMLQFCDCLLIEHGKEFQVFHYVAIICVDPVLVEAVRRGEIWIEPDRSSFSFSKFDTSRGCHEWKNQPIPFRSSHLANEFRAS